MKRPNVMFQSFARNIGVGAVQKHTEIRDAELKNVNPCPNTEAGNHAVVSQLWPHPRVITRNVIANMMMGKF